MMRDSYIKACRGESQTVPPVWFMRQAGRYLPEYRKLREHHAMLELCRSPELAAQVTLMPIQRFDFDAAILFSDITMPYYGLGIPFEIKEGVGPVVAEPVRSLQGVHRLQEFDASEKLGFVGEAIKILKQELTVPLIGFVGAPFTLAAYLIEGKPSRDFKNTKKFMMQEEAAWGVLMDKLTAATLTYIDLQASSGVNSLQVFDSWIGGLNERGYLRFVAPWMEKIFARIREHGIPSIHFGTGTSSIMPAMKKVGADVMGVDWRMTLREAQHKCGIQTPLQGNLDPSILLGPRSLVVEETKAILEESRELKGFIFNLGHGILPETPLENVEAVLHCIRG